MSDSQRQKGFWILLFVLAAYILFVGNRWMNWGPSWHFSIFSLFGFYGAIAVGTAVWVGVDAHRRGNNGWLWGGFTLITFPVGLLVYWLLEKEIKIARRGVDDVHSSEEGGGSVSQGDPSRHVSTAPVSGFSKEGAADSNASSGSSVAGSSVSDADAGKRSVITQAPNLCPACSAPVRDEYKHCPYCATALHRKCPHCLEPVEMQWKACAQCGRPLAVSPDVAPEYSTPPDPEPTLEAGPESTGEVNQNLDEGLQDDLDPHDQTLPHDQDFKSEDGDKSRDD